VTIGYKLSRRLCARIFLVTISHKGIVSLLAGTLLFAGAGCGGGKKPTDVVLVTHDSFVVSKDVRRAFEHQSGLKWRILQSGDAGEALTKALLTAGNPQGDVFFGVDNNLLSRALAGGLFDAYTPAGLDHVDRAYDLDSEHHVVPVDHSEVCVVYDRSWFSSHHVSPPRKLTDLVLRRYRGLTVVENPATSTPGLAFLLATIAHYGDFTWHTFWEELRANNVLVSDGWEEAYNARFSGGSGHGGYPIVVSYSTDPAAAVYFAGKALAQSTVAVIPDTCFRQIEFAGILRGTHNEKGAKELIDFMLSKRFQVGMPLTMFVLPARNGVPLPPVFLQFAPSIPKPLQLSPQTIGANRDRWVREWTDIVIR
jgi:thiamine transport system substrate-binding protein